MVDNALIHANSRLLRRLVNAMVAPWSGDVVFLAIALAIPLRFASRLFGNDGDVGRHIRVGNDILHDGTFFFLDRYSFTMGGRAFVPYEWLSEVVFALAHRVGGLAAVAVLTGVIAGLTSYLVVIFIRVRGGDAGLALLAGFGSAVLGAIHWLARPHLFTPLMTILVLHLIERRGRLSLFLFGPVFLLWANLHGGFTFSLILIGCYSVGELAEWAFHGRTKEWLDRALYHLVALGISGVACLINPSGPGLFSHVFGFLGDRYLVDNTQEYLSPNFHQLGRQIFLLAVLLTIAMIALGPDRLTLPELTVILVLTAFSLYAQRNIPLFAVTVVPLLAVSANRSWLAFRPIQRFRRMIANGERHSQPGLWAAFALVFVTALAIHHGTFAGLTVNSEFGAAQFPTAAVEQAKRDSLTGRMFNDFTWGGYVLYAWPEEKVFIDGQTDFYGDEVTAEYQQISGLEAGWRDALRARQIDFALIRSDSLLSRELAREPGWHVWYMDQTATILRREN